MPDFKDIQINVKFNLSGMLRLFKAKLNKQGILNIGTFEYTQE